MAVKLKTNTTKPLYFWPFMGLLGGALPSHHDFLAANELELVTQLSGLELHMAGGIGVRIALAVGPAMALAQGKVSAEVLPPLKQAVHAAIGYFMDKVNNNDALVSFDYYAEMAKTGSMQVGAMTLLLQGKPAPAFKEPGPKAPAGQTPPAPAAKWPYFDPQTLKSAPTIKLRDATRMYEPVQGSSPQSRYFLVAANQDLRIAARYKGTSLSVRIEGPSWEKHKHQIAACGFDNVQVDKGYASIHLHVGDPITAGKALGAILLGLGMPLETPLPELKMIQNVGS